MPDSRPSTKLRSSVTSSKVPPVSQKLASQAASSWHRTRTPAPELCSHAFPSGLCFQAPLFDLSLKAPVTGLSLTKPSLRGLACSPSSLLRYRSRLPAATSLAFFCVFLLFRDLFDEVVERALFLLFLIHIWRCTPVRPL